MAYSDPSITTSGTTFAQLQAGGLSALLEALITTNSSLLTPVVDANNNTEAATLKKVRAAKAGRLQFVYDSAAKEVNDFLRGDPVLESDLIAKHKQAHTAFAMIAQAFHEIGVLIDANQGTLKPIQNGIGQYSTGRTFP